jgi:serine/threonine protein kinase
MAAENVIDLALDRMADGLPVDWSELDSEANSDAEREELRCLRILEEVAALHRSTEDPVTSVEEGATHDSAPDSSKTTTGPAEMWGRYRLVAKVGEGSFGSVHRAWDPELEWEVAIKILHRKIADDQLKERLRREGRALAQVQHPNVVRVLSIESHGDRVGLCMEFVHGESLDAVLRKGTLSAREAVLVGEDVCRALAAVHHAGFVHRDVKARNVMRDRTGRIVLMDFGTGRQADQLQTSGSLDIAGTPVYMAPEVLAGQGASVSSDVYSVGVLLYHLVSAAYPVEGRTMDDLRAAHLQGRRRPLIDRRPDLPLPFVQVVERALAPDPQQRYSSAGALLEALATLTNETPPARPVLASRLSNAALAVVGGASALTALGVVVSSRFNLALERSDFAVETVPDWFVWGVRSSLKPLAILMAAVLIVALLTVLRRVLLAVSPHGRRLDAAVRQRVDAVAHRLRLDDVTILACCVLVASVSVLLVAWWYFSPLLKASVTPISTAPVEDLARLSPGFSAFQDRYREVFTYISFFSIFAWYPVVRLARRRQQVLNWRVVSGGVVVAVLAFVSLDLPYRLFLQATFDTARWNGSDCYILGERVEDRLIFCPAIPPPRSRIVPKDEVQRSGTHENIFTKFSPGPTP